MCFRLNPKISNLHSIKEFTKGKCYFHLFQARLKAEHEYLLLVSRTRTDEQGRRHSIAVPVIPPPDGVKFEGGYHVERNPINGAARLVPPDGEKLD